MEAQRPNLSIIVPCRDEEENVPLLAEELRRELARAGIDAWETLFVDDGSADATAKRAEEEVLRGPTGRFRALRLERGAGQSAAMEAGLRAARGRLLLVMDGDLQHPPSQIPALLAPILAGRADCVCGYRVGRQASDSWRRRIEARIANAVRDRVTGDRVRDGSCTFRAFRPECVERVKFFRGVHRFLATLIRHEGFAVVEVPVRCRARRHGRSKYGPWERARAGLVDALAVRWMRSRTTRWRLRS